MPDSNKPFVVTDRRKFTKEGELRPDVPHREPQPRPEAAAAPTPAPQLVPGPQAPNPQAPNPQAPGSQARAQTPGPQVSSPHDPDPLGEDVLPASTPEQNEQARIAYEHTADRLDVAIRAANPGADHPPQMNFDQLVQSLYLTAIMQLGGGTPEGEKPRIDILGGRQSIDMLAVVSNRTRGNLTPAETTLIESALFELRMAFLEITQAFARSAAAQGPGQGPGSGPGPKGAPSSNRPGLIF